MVAGCKVFPYDPRMPCVWCDGKWIDDGQLSIAADDRGLLHGLGAFETMLAVDGAIRHVGKHLSRLQKSVDLLGLPSLENIDIGAVVTELCAKNHCDTGRARIRLTLTAGEGTLRNLQPGATARIIISAVSCPPQYDSLRVITLPWLRNDRSPLAGLKTTSYAENLVALDWARQRGADEGVFFNTSGHLCEGTTSTVVLVVAGSLFTPPLSSGCLPGVMREVLIESAVKQGIPLIEQEISRELFSQAEAIVFTSATRGVVAASACDGKNFTIPDWLRPLMQACF